VSQETNAIGGPARKLRDHRALDVAVVEASAVGTIEGLLG
jgi:hypothetical protein